MKDHPEDAARMRSDPLFFQRCVHESLRLHPASPTAWRRATCPFALDNGQHVPQDTRVVLDMAGANRDRSVFGETADQFDPHRKLGPGQMPFGLTFGSGLHACLGRDLDGGVVAREDTDPATHQYGIITLFARRIVAEGARLNPADPPTAATYTARPNWGRYPVIFDRDLKWAQ